MHPLLNIAERAARSAGKIILKGFERLDLIKIKEKQPNDFVTNIDYHAEQTIIEIIKAAYPEHGILAEESGQQNGDEFLWVIDPLDGTLNFLHGFPHFSVSIAIKRKERIEHALIYDPIRQEIFTASRGQGAQLNQQKRLRVNTRRNLKDALLGISISYKSPSQLEHHCQLLKYFMGRHITLRRCGSAALDLAYLAAGRLDGFWGLGLAPWDSAAGILLIQESGGIVCDLQGNENYFETGSIVAANPKLCKPLLQAISQIPMNDA
jgi:myo-inositol-1(or 4)-monophosphatase